MLIISRDHGLQHTFYKRLNEAFSSKNEHRTHGHQTPKSAAGKVLHGFKGLRLKSILIRNVIQEIRVMTMFNQLTGPCMTRNVIVVITCWSTLQLAIYRVRLIKVQTCGPDQKINSVQIQSCTCADRCNYLVLIAAYCQLNWSWSTVIHDLAPIAACCYSYR